MTDGREEMKKDTPGGLIALVAGFALGVVVAWIYWEQREQRPQSPAPKLTEEERVPLEPGPEASSREPKAAEEREPDDLTRVEGIGPKMSSVLRNARIMTFEQLAESDPEELYRILCKEGLPFADPSTWPEQATLAAVGAWQDLDALQEELSGGRRVG
jgi:predicted flap endonuclease-1-like 5' DNA nuclease